jgi:hypothetical protein
MLFAFYVCTEILKFFHMHLRDDVKKEFWTMAIMDALLYVLSCTDFYKHNIVVQMYWLYVSPAMAITLTLSMLLRILFFCEEVDGLYQELFEVNVVRHCRAAAAAAA